MSVKRRKISWGPLPVDCIGEICEFVWEPSVFLKLYTISHHVKWYFDEEHPFACENVEFVSCRIGVDVTCEKKYVVRVYLRRDIPLRFFPNLKCLTVEFVWCDEYFSVLPELKYMEDVIQSVQSWLSGDLTNEILLHFRKLKKVNIGCLNSVTDEGIKHLECVEDLSICNLEEVTGSAFEFTKNLRKLKAESSGIRNESMCFLHQIEDLDISYCSNISSRGLNNLPETVVNTLHTLRTKWSANISNLAISRFKSLKYLIDPFEYTGLSCDVLKSFPKLEKIKLWPGFSHVRLGEIADNIVSDHFNELYISGKDSKDQLDSLSKFKNLTKLTIYSNYVNKEWIRDIARSCENLEELTILQSEILTSDDLKPLKKMKSLRKVKFRNCSGIPDDYKMKME